MPVAQPDPNNLREYDRFTFAGPPFELRVGGKKYPIRLKDVSCGGAAGIMEEPVACGDSVSLTFDGKHMIVAEVRWVRRVLVGLRFTRQLDAHYVARMYDRFASGKTVRVPKDPDYGSPFGAEDIAGEAPPVPSNPEAYMALPPAA